MIRDEKITAMMGAGAASLLLGALGFQYLKHLPPCEMCHWQRWPHMAAILIAAIGLSIWKWDRRLLVILIIGAVALSGVVITAQWQVAIFIALAALALMAASFCGQDARLLAVMAVLLVAVSGLIGAYQTGMQMGILPGPGACTVDHPYVMGSGAPPPEVSCNAVTWSLFGLSLAAYNAIVSLLIAGTGAVLLSRKHAA
ncbi:MAG TPA: disulfide bond formation protein B [Rhizomicrobium sp.]|nr:disulfide bond formation protein B [Rhizomicrobium sp.]